MKGDVKLDEKVEDMRAERDIRRRRLSEVSWLAAFKSGRVDPVKGITATLGLHA